MLSDPVVTPTWRGSHPVATTSLALTVGTTTWTTSVVRTVPDW